MAEAMAATNTGPSGKVLSISLADRHWLTNLPGKIFSACIKFGGNRFTDVETHRFYTHTHIHTHTHPHTHTHTHLNEIIYYIYIYI